jgi:hypothetical protein
MYLSDERIRELKKRVITGACNQEGITEDSYRGRFLADTIENCFNEVIARKEDNFLIPLPRELCLEIIFAAIKEEDTPFDTIARKYGFTVPFTGKVSEREDELFAKFMEPKEKREAQKIEEETHSVGPDDGYLVPRAIENETERDLLRATSEIIVIETPVMVADEFASNAGSFEMNKLGDEPGLDTSSGEGTESNDVIPEEGSETEVQDDKETDES